MCPAHSLTAEVSRAVFSPKEVLSDYVLQSITVHILLIMITPSTLFGLALTVYKDIVLDFGLSGSQDTVKKTCRRALGKIRRILEK